MRNHAAGGGVSDVGCACSRGPHKQDATDPWHLTGPEL